jgi:hypothetical protein
MADQAVDPNGPTINDATIRASSDLLNTPAFPAREWQPRLTAGRDGRQGIHSKQAWGKYE